MNRIQAINGARAYLNEAAPRVINELAPVTRRKRDGGLWANDWPQLHQPGELGHAYLEVGLSRIYLNVRVRYERNERAWGYYDTHVLVWNAHGATTYEALPLLTEEGVQEAQAEYRALEEAIRELARRATKLRIDAQLEQDITTITF